MHMKVFCQVSFNFAISMLDGVFAVRYSLYCSEREKKFIFIFEFSETISFLENQTISSFKEMGVLLFFLKVLDVLW